MQGLTQSYVRTAQDRRWPQAASSTPTMETETRDGERARTSADLGPERWEDTTLGTQSAPLPPSAPRQLAPSGVPRGPAGERSPLPQGTGPLTYSPLLRLHWVS